jgi:hypothetical protein
LASAASSGHCGVAGSSGAGHPLQRTRSL